MGFDHRLTAFDSIPGTGLGKAFNRIVLNQCLSFAVSISPPTFAQREIHRYNNRALSPLFFLTYPSHFSSSCGSAKKRLIANYFLKSLIISFITIIIIPIEMPPRINANKAFVATKMVQTLKNSSHGHSKKLISSCPLKHCRNLL
ncbi:MAG: hypothetical protein K2Y09_11960 [Nitrosomonas sp.]|uniref:hypothetical protein n=1 Tax=Nitrosomonas sp. TaxID=42353 RepID=UPI001D72D25D|nr:hypothetical protein [Nitrosomonas sp.]MBX9895866.1 hypothetical protein [Nitrosomonas sp.]